MKNVLGKSQAEFKKCIPGSAGPESAPASATVSVPVLAIALTYRNSWTAPTAWTTMGTRFAESARIRTTSVATRVPASAVARPHPLSAAPQAVVLPFAAEAQS